MLRKNARYRNALRPVAAGYLEKERFGWADQEGTRKIQKISFLLYHVLYFGQDEK